MTEPTTPLEALLEHLKRTRGFDFTGYKRSSLERRITKRMEAVGDGDYGEYLDRLEVEPDEFHALFDTILINVTGFFRDPPTWEYLAKEALPELLAAVGDEGPIRVWCAGCASGEEAYSLVMALADLMGEPAYCERVKVYATDVDDHALAQARAATYTAKDVEPVPPAALQTYFDKVDGNYVFRKDYRRTVIFGRNDLVQDAPISRIDLLSCRNTLMYFNADTQATILRRLHFALNDRGYLVLGKSEMLITRGDLFRPVNLRRRVFTKLVGARAENRRDNARVQEAPAHGVPQEAALEAGLVASLVVDADNNLVHANRRAREDLGVSAHDVGRLLQDAEVSFRPVELRSHLEHVTATRRVHVIPDVVHQTAGGARRRFDVHVTPLLDREAVIGAAISYYEITHLRRAEEDLEGSRRELETAYEELQSTVEELETTNEELQSTNEELETTNEEIQASNEELETMNEELQSTNEELETINDELRSRTGELNDVNEFLETVLLSLGLGVAVVDREQTVQVWNGRAVDMWGLRPEEAVGQRLLGLDFGLPVTELRAPLRTVLSGLEEKVDVVVASVDRLGRPLACDVSVLPLHGNGGGDGDGNGDGNGADGAVTGAIVLMQRDGARP